MAIWGIMFVILQTVYGMVYNIFSRFLPVLPKCIRADSSDVRHRFILEFQAECRECNQATTLLNMNRD